MRVIFYPQEMKSDGFRIINNQWNLFVHWQMYKAHLCVWRNISKHLRFSIFLILILNNDDIMYMR